MARDLITPIKCTEMSTGTMKLSSDLMVKISTANGAYIKTGGSSNIDGSRLLFACMRSSGNSNAAYIYVRAGSTAGKKDFEPGAYSTARDFVIKIPESTRGLIGRSTAGATSFGSSIAPNNPVFFSIPETARFKDSDGYIKLDFSTAISSGGGTTERSMIGAIYFKP